VQVLVQLAEKSDKRAARFDRSKIGFHPNVAEAKASAIAVCSRNASKRDSVPVAVQAPAPAASASWTQSRARRRASRRRTGAATCFKIYQNASKRTKML